MKSKLVQEFTLSALLIFLLLALLNPLHFWMPDEFLMMLVAALVVAFSLFSIFVWRERARDEREGLHLLFAGRAGFVAGASTLVLGIVIESFTHAIDVWLVLALGAMIFAKVAGLFYARRRN